MIKFVNCLQKNLDRLTKLFFLIINLSYVTTVLSIVIQVIARYVFNSPTAWSEELARLSFIWLAVLVFPIGIRTGSHIGFDMFKVYIGTLSKKAELILEIIRYVLVTITLIIFAYNGFLILPAGARQLTPALSIKFSYVYSVVPIAMIFGIFCELERFLKNLLE